MDVELGLSRKKLKIVRVCNCEHPKALQLGKLSSPLVTDVFCAVMHSSVTVPAFDQLAR